MDRVRALDALLDGSDRAAHRRSDREWLQDQPKAPAWLVPHWRGQSFFARDGDRLALAVRLEAHAPDSGQAVFLGTRADGQTLFALDLSSQAETQDDALDWLPVARSAAFFVNLRAYDG
jgi:hypothetical protein